MVKHFPKQVFVTIDSNDDANDNEKGLLAWREIQEGVEDNGPTRVAVYQLVEVKQIVLTAHEV